LRYDPLKHHRRSVRLAGYDYAAPGAYFVTICTHRRQMFFDQLKSRHLAEACWRAIPEHTSHVELDDWVVMPNHIHGLIVIVDHGEANNAENVEEIVADHRRGIQLNAPTTNTLDDLTTKALNISTSNTLENTDDRGRGVQLNAPTTMTMNLSTANTTVDSAINTLAQPRYVDNPFSVMSPRRNTLSVIIRTYKAAVTTACRAAGRSEFAWQRGYYEHVVRNPRELRALRRYIRDNLLKWALDRDNPANMRHLAAPVSVADYLADLALMETP